MGHIFVRQVFSFLVAFTWALVNPVALCFASEQSLSVEVRGSTVDIVAEHVPLEQVLKTLAEKASFELEVKTPLEQDVSCQWRGIGIEELIRRLLANRNYMLSYGRAADGQYLPSELKVAAEGLMKSMGDSVTAVHPMESVSIKQVDRAWLEQQHDTIFGEVVAVSTEKGPMGHGIQIEEIQEDSFLAAMGVRKGDIIDEINGIPVKSQDDLVEVMLRGSANLGTLRISRHTQDGQTDPIYLQLE
jgi:C-terminal processing protease CtpA/Prc